MDDKTSQHTEDDYTEFKIDITKHEIIEPTIGTDETIFHNDADTKVKQENVDIDNLVSNDVLTLENKAVDEAITNILFPATDLSSREQITEIQNSAVCRSSFEISSSPAGSCQTLITALLNKCSNREQGLPDAHSIEPNTYTLNKGNEDTEEYRIKIESYDVSNTPSTEVMPIKLEATNSQFSSNNDGHDSEFILPDINYQNVVMKTEIEIAITEQSYNLGSAQNGAVSLTDDRTVNNNKNDEVAKTNFESGTVNEKIFKSTEPVNHMRTHTGKKAFICNICQKKLATKTNLMSHMRIHTGEKSFSCVVCKKKFAQQTYLDRHMLIHTGEKPYSCEYCPFKTAHRGSLTTHIKIHANKTKQDTNLLNMHRSHIGSQTYICHVCGSKFTQKLPLVVHMRMHDESTFSCDVCQCTFARRHSFARHMKKHTAGGTYTCIHCDYKCASMSDLKAHAVVHIDEKPFACEFCDFKSAGKGNLSTHMRTHRAHFFRCDYCDYKNKEKSALDAHVRRHFFRKRQRLYPCNLCRKRYCSITNLDKHLKTHSEESTHSCEYCRYKTDDNSCSKSSMVIHTQEKGFLTILPACKHQNKDTTDNTQAEPPDNAGVI